ncbi:MAG: GNAT family N-acetyltransferase [Reyranellaceae bacterium]
MTVSFRPAGRADLPLLARWLAQPHVERWWPDPEKALAGIADHLDDPAIECFVIVLDGREAGYLQCYDPHAWPEHPFADRPRGSRGLDMFIGEPDLVGRGHGSRATRAFVDRLFAAGAPEALIDPHPDNAMAIRAYGKAGFAAYRECDTPWGRVVLMRLPNPALNGSRAT